MGDPIVFISRSAVTGSPEALGDAVRGAASAIERDKPGTVAFLPYVSDDGDELSIVHIFPDADAMRAHLQGVNERVAAAAEVIETLGYEIYGSPDDETLETMRGFATRQGVPLTVRPRSLGGYLRPVVGSTGVAT